jgi:hypothetical protein
MQQQACRNALWPLGELIAAGLISNTVPNENVAHEEVSEMDEKYLAARRVVSARGGPGSQTRIKVTIQRAQQERQPSKPGTDEPTE